MLHPNRIPVRERRLIAERNVMIKEAFGSWRTGFHQTAPEEGGSITYKTLYHDLSIAFNGIALVHSDLNHPNNRDSLSVVLYRRADKAMVSRVLGKDLLKTKVHLGEHLIFKHNMELCKFKESPGNHPPPTDSDCATRFKIVNKKSAQIYTHTNPDQSKKRRFVVTDEDDGESEGEEDAGAGKNDAKRDSNFKKIVAHRDRKCVVTGIANRYGGMGTSADNLWVGPGIEGAHIVPWARPELLDVNLTAAIKRQRAKEAKLAQEQGAPLPVATKVDVNAVENGVILRSDLHALFDAWLWTVDPYSKTIRQLVPLPALTAGAAILVSPRQFPPPEIWNWHYNQCVLRMLRAGAYAPDDEHDYEDGEKAQLFAAANEELSDDITRTAALLQRLLLTHTAFRDDSHAADATPPPASPAISVV
ncbi:hypothetical protein FN846DRAFT_910765 [Sphaerosporella brunnea]|uniref:HNH nuclease domain-containing protein n=1 Tax=Sphaerosporella brunnea TaxID=1250544 RepID=A0A5J5EMR3_9PEZI|nr:hypothetical protein FN846DRAFT_910765 [Sphaerosporella brunnea]